MMFGRKRKLRKLKKRQRELLAQIDRARSVNARLKLQRR
jgi:hypothetical protein